MMNLRLKLHPANFTRMSGRMAACVGFILGEVFTEPQITSILVTSDGFVLAMNVGAIGHNELIGSEADLKRNWDALLVAAELTAEERIEASRLFDLKV